MVFEAHNLTISFSGTLSNVPFLAIKEKVLGKKYNLSISFVSPKKALELNKTYRNKDYTPNTLSFSLSQSSGEIILCKNILRQEYKKFGMDYQTYQIFILIHSCLHLKGMEHGCTMETAEQKYLLFFTQSAKINEAKHRNRH